MVIRFSAAWLAAVLLCLPPAFAKPTSPTATNESREKEARKDCLSGKSDAGIAILAELFAETKDTVYVHNQARCFQQATRFDEAIYRFREYLRIAKNLSAEERAEVDKHIAECQAGLVEQEKRTGAARPVPQPTPTAAPAAIASSAATPPSQAFVAVPPALDLTAKPESARQGSAPGTRPFYKTWWFWTGAAAVVVAGTVTAILLAGRSSGPCDGASLVCRGVK